MKQVYFLLGLSLLTVKTYACNKCEDYNNEDFQIKNVNVKHQDDLAATIWEITVKGTAGKTTPAPAGQMNGAPVLGYVFPTTLKSTDVGFGDTEGIVALALTSHPDFDDTPLWDENADRNFVNDGIVWHPHWVVLTQDKRVEGGLAVKQFDPKDTGVVLPPTNPGMPMYMDSPGFQVITDRNTIRVVVPDYRMNNKTDFSYDGIAAFMQVNTGGEGGKNKPMLGVYKVYSVASGDLSLPYKVK
ncbi:hypothetical protein [Flagellimonas halotolerans]|uniref:Uncharacterized protein n=1 Tax=Flagellimonas halotolerans TaxID=3112164 RepID=A0ABU6IUQ3_9FLAO|nr:MULTISPECIES: hypothetical protein [unclassified Allomuricauda]MEC3966997.1 hypothetical protein [Muricauda sp. SYSU M86414]MEC4266860.1 hypothetical protein [Muricauda sp. SYSU M84420]